MKWACPCGAINPACIGKCHLCGSTLHAPAENLNKEIDSLAQQLFSAKSEIALLRLANRELTQTLKDVVAILDDSIPVEQFVDMEPKVLKEMAKQHDHLINKAIERIGSVND